MVAEGWYGIMWSWRTVGMMMSWELRRHGVMLLYLYTRNCTRHFSQHIFTMGDLLVKNIRIGVVDTHATKIKIHFFLECFHSESELWFRLFLPCSHVLLVCCPPTLTCYDGLMTLLYKQTFQSLTLCNFETHTGCPQKKLSLGM